jgi:hypothetical protein
VLVRARGHLVHEGAASDEVSSSLSPGKAKPSSDNNIPYVPRGQSGLMGSIRVVVVDLKLVLVGARRSVTQLFTSHPFRRAGRHQVLQLAQRSACGNGEDTQRMEPTPNDPTLHSLTPFDSFASIYETILGRSDFRVFLMSGWRCGRTVKSTRYYESCDVQIALQMHGRTNTEHEHGQATLTQLMAALIAGCPLGRVWATGGLYWCVRRERL